MQLRPCVMAVVKSTQVTLIMLRVLRGGGCCVKLPLPLQGHATALEQLAFIYIRSLFSAQRWDLFAPDP